MENFLKEPLLIFLLLGGAMFVLFQKVSDDAFSGLEQRDKIVLTVGHMQALSLGFDKVWQRSPSAKELDGLIQNYIREEVYYREALALGLDRDDNIVRRRLRQKMEFISDDIANLETPKEEELLAYLAAHQEDYRQSSRFSFRQIYFNTSIRGQAAQTDARMLLGRLQDNVAVGESLGDPLMVNQKFSNKTEREIERALGAKFLQSLRDLPTGRWQGAIQSGFGLHLVYIDERIDGQLSDLKDVRDLVIRDWSSEKRKKTNEVFYESLRKRYKVVVENSNGKPNIRRTNANESTSKLSMVNDVQ